MKENKFEKAAQKIQEKYGARCEWIPMNLEYHVNCAGPYGSAREAEAAARKLYLAEESRLTR